MPLTTRERGVYKWGAYIRVEKRVTNLGGLYSRELIHGGAYLRNFTVVSNDFCISVCKTNFTVHHIPNTIMEHDTRL